MSPFPITDDVHLLPAKLLAASHHFPMDKQIPTTDDCAFGLNLSFPDEFPYEFDSPAISIDTPFSDDEKLEKLWPSVGSPQSTLGGIWSWSGRSTGSSPSYPSTGSSPPTTPFEDREDTLKLIYAAAGQVAMMKMSGEIPVRRPSSTSGLNYSGTGYYTSKNNTHYIHPHTNQMKLRWQLSSSSPLGLPQSAWPSLQGQGQVQQRQCVGSTIRPGSGISRESTGTGVFIPRIQSNIPDYHRTAAGSAKIGQPVKSNNEANKLQYVRLSDPFEARRSVILTQQKGRLRAEGSLENEACLPQEWTY